MMRGWVGAITLSLGLGLPISGMARAIATQVLEGELTEDDRTFSDGSHYDVYQFEGKAGETVAVEGD